MTDVVEPRAPERPIECDAAPPPPATEALTRRATDALASGRFADAAEASAQVAALWNRLGSSRAELEARAFHAECLAEWGLIAPARAVAEEVLRAPEASAPTPLRGRAARVIAMGAIELGALDEALRHLAPAREPADDPSAITGEILRAVIQIAHDDLAGADAALSALIAARRPDPPPARGRVHAYLAVVRCLQGRPWEAAEELRAAARLAPAPAALEQQTRRTLDAYHQVAASQIARARGDVWAWQQARTAASRAVLAEASAAVTSGLTSFDYRITSALLGRTLDRAPGLADAPRPADALAIGPHALWFERAGGARVGLARRRLLRRLLAALVARHHLAPGVAVSTGDLLEIGWPGQRIAPASASARLWVAIGALRKLGLGAVLRRSADGYLLDPQLTVSFVVADAPAADAGLRDVPRRRC